MAQAPERHVNDPQGQLMASDIMKLVGFYQMRMIIGASAIDHDGALLDFDFREVKVAQAIIANARHVILVSDQTKFERTAPVRIGHLSQVNTFITDRCDIPSVRRICEEREVRLIETALE